MWNGTVLQEILVLKKESLLFMPTKDLNSTIDANKVSAVSPGTFSADSVSLDDGFVGQQQPDINPGMSRPDLDTGSLSGYILVEASLVTAEAVTIRNAKKNSASWKISKSRTMLFCMPFWVLLIVILISGICGSGLCSDFRYFKRFVRGHVFSSFHSTYSILNSVRGVNL